MLMALPVGKCLFRYSLLVLVRCPLFALMRLGAKDQGLTLRRFAPSLAAHNKSTVIARQDGD